MSHDSHAATGHLARRVEGGRRTDRDRSGELEKPPASPRDVELVILIVDDRPHNLFALEQLLKDTPAKLVTAQSGDEALALSLVHDFSLAILDVQMPGMDGYELAELLLGNPSTASLPIIFVSAAYGDEAHRFRGYESGAVDYLVKPIEPKILLGKVTVFLELARMRAKLEALVRERTLALSQRAEQLALRSRVKRLVCEVSREVIRRNPSDTHQAVVAALGKVARFVGASHAVVLSDPVASPDRHEQPESLRWHAPGEGAPRDEPSRPELLAAIFSLRALQRGDGVALPSGAARAADAGRLADAEVADADADADAERAVLAGLGPHAALLLPIVEEERCLGVVAFGWSLPTELPRTFDELPSLLAIVPEVLYSALERAAAESQRAETQAQHLLLFATMSQGVVYQKAEGEIFAANPAAERILGLTSDELAVRRAEDPRSFALREDGTLFGADEHPATVALRTGQAVDGVVMGVFNPKDADYRWISVSAVPLFRPGTDTPFQVYTTFADMTELRRATAEKERLMNIEAESRAKSRFLASMSHEIRTPMNAILGYTQLLLREAGLTARQRDYLETIDRSGEHLITLVNNVLDMARIESGKESVELAPVDLVDILTDAERMFRLRASEKRLAFRVERGASPPRRLRLDAGKIRQVLFNLLSNALKFTQAGEVVLRTTTTAIGAGKIRVVLEVHDTGIGIPPDKLSDVFEPFVQVSRSSASLGAGIGLSVCRRFARLMGGEISVVSRLGLGSTFRFEFDAENAATMPLDPTPERVVGLVNDATKVRVLLVEDDPDNRAMMTNLIRSVGFSVREAADAREAVEAFTKEPADIVLTDLRMPDADGLDLMRLLRQLPGGAEVPVVVVSASTTTEERARVLSAGADGFVSKPVRESGIFSEIARLTRAKLVYAGESEPAAVDAGPLTHARVAMVPIVLRRKLLDAITRGYPDVIATEIDAIERCAPDVARELRVLADGFAYEQLFDLLHLD